MFTQPKGHRSEPSLQAQYARSYKDNAAAASNGRGLNVPVHCVAASAASAGRSSRETPSSRERRRQVAGPTPWPRVDRPDDRRRIAARHLVRPREAAPRSGRQAASAFHRTTCGSITAIAIAVRRAVARGQRIGAGVRRAEHRLLDGDAGLVRAEQHGAARREVVGLGRARARSALRAAARRRARTGRRPRGCCVVTKDSTACEIAS